MKAFPVAISQTTIMAVATVEELHQEVWLRTWTMSEVLHVKSRSGQLAELPATTFEPPTSSVLSKVSGPFEIALSGRIGTCSPPREEHRRLSEGSLASTPRKPTSISVRPLSNPRHWTPLAVAISFRSPTVSSKVKLPI